MNGEEARKLFDDANKMIKHIIKNNQTKVIYFLNLFNILIQEMRFKNKNLGVK